MRRRPLCQKSAKSRRQCASDKGAAGRLFMQVKLNTGSGFTDTSTAWMVGYNAGNALSGGLSRVWAAFSRGERQAQGVAGQNIGGLLARH